MAFTIQTLPFYLNFSYIRDCKMQLRWSNTCQMWIWLRGCNLYSIKAYLTETFNVTLTIIAPNIKCKLWFSQIRCAITVMVPAVTIRSHLLIVIGHRKELAISRVSFNSLEESLEILPPNGQAPAILQNQYYIYISNIIFIYRFTAMPQHGKAFHNVDNSPLTVGIPSLERAIWSVGVFFNVN